MPDLAFVTLVIIIILGLGFDYINGFHDTANAIATSVATRVLTPGRAVLMAACLNFIGALTGTTVAGTVGKGIVQLGDATQLLVIAALISAITWNLITWYFGIPSSSSHALIFSIVGSGLALGGPSAIQLSGVTKTFQGLGLSPLLGFGGAFALMALLLWIFARARPRLVSALFGRLQIVSAAYMAFSHGGNDAQKTMGVITMALASYYGWTGDEWRVPFWVVASAATATVIEISSRLGIPVSTTHVISSAILGVGATKRLSAVRWGVAGRIVTAWVVTIPACTAFGWLVYSLLDVIIGAR